MNAPAAPAPSRVETLAFLALLAGGCSIAFAPLFVRLSDAIRIMRGGEGDPAAEEGLLRLAAATGWIPSLGMSITMAKTHLSKFADDE